MRFDDWFIEAGKSAEAVAFEILQSTGRRMSGSTVWKIALGRHKPGTENASAIVNVTGGKVTLDDLAAGPRDPSRLRRPARRPPRPPADLDPPVVDPPPSGGIQVVAGGPGMVSVPLLGYVPAGPLTEEEQGLGERVDVPRACVGRGRCYAVRATGESMTGAGVLPGDIILVRQLAPGELPANGQTVIALVDGQNTLKRFERRGAKIALLPAHEGLKPILVPIERVQIQGVVVHSQRFW